MEDGASTPEATAARFSGLSPVLARYGVFLGVIGAAILALAPCAALAERSLALGLAWLALVSMVLAVLVLARSRVAVGPEGVVTAWLGRRRFIPLRRIVGAHTSVAGWGRYRVHGAVLCLDGGGAQKIPASEEVSVAIADAVTDALIRGDERLPPAVPALEMGTRSVREWIDALRVIGDGGSGGFRDAPVAPPTLWRIVESAGARVDHRAAAAVALSSSADAGVARRLRVAVEGTLDPRLRVAVHAATSGRDAELATALGDVVVAPEVRASASGRGEPGR